MKKKCYICGKKKPATLEFFFRCKQSKDGLTYQCKECDRKRYHVSPVRKAYRKANSLQRYRDLREEVLTVYGRKCVCCGETEMVFLVIDHVNGGGNGHRRQLLKEGTSTYLWLKRNNFPSGFQVLCHNCNFAKNLGSCPHRKNTLLGSQTSTSLTSSQL